MSRLARLPICALFLVLPSLLCAADKPAASLKDKIGKLSKHVKKNSYTDYFDEDGHRYVQVVRDDSDGSILKCDFLGDRVNIQLTLGLPLDEGADVSIFTKIFGKLTGHEKYENRTRKEMDKIIADCATQKDEDGSWSWSDFFQLLDPTKALKELMHNLAIFPGTKWCGAGDIASGYDDLGRAVETDTCCRAHDLSPEDIKVGKTKYNLKNPLPYTMTRCNYDNALYDCLKDAGTATSNAVGVMFFNILRTKCFDYVKPAECVSGMLGNCNEYQFDEEGPLSWQILEPKTFHIQLSSKTEAGMLHEATQIASQLKKHGRFEGSLETVMKNSLGDIGHKFPTFHPKLSKALKSVEADIKP